MKKWILTGVVIVWTLFSCSTKDQNSNRFMPAPTEIKWDMEEGAKSKDRQTWFDQMHQAAPGVNWKQIEYETAYKKHVTKSLQRASLQKRTGEESFANGLVRGVWEERGSTNQSGSVVGIAYDQEADMIYTIGAGGSLWRTPREPVNWQLVNDDLRFDGHILHFIKTPSGQKRMISAVNAIPHYSDDMGATWIPSTGLQSLTTWAHIDGSATYTFSGNSSQIIIIQKSDFWDHYHVYLSVDGGQHFEKTTNLGTHQSNLIDLDALRTKEGVFMQVITNGQPDILQWEPIKLAFESMELPAPDAIFEQANLEVTSSDSQLKLYTYDSDNYLHYLQDTTGQSWQQLQNVAQEGIWESGIFVSEHFPSLIVAGAVEAHRSFDHGQSFAPVNRWWDYYPDPSRFLHADIMWMSEYTTGDGVPFFLINTHGGMYISYNNTGKLENISLEGLNVSQYYDVKSHPEDDQAVFGGTQDQGFQRGYLGEDGPQPFEQVISGDYGHLTFTDNRILWMVYPYGAISYMVNPEFGPVNGTYTIESDEESVWIVPTMPDPDPNQNIIYAAGGNANGGPGRYLLKLELRAGQIEASNMPFDFSSSEGDITAMAVDPTNRDIWYVGTSNGRIYKSEDRGLNFTKLASSIPGSHYLYGSDILVSSRDTGTVYVGGSGYSTAALRVSTDGGGRFRSKINGLPNTTIFQMAFNEDESLLYAATEAGPYVYVIAEEQWYDLSGVEVPNQTFWSVEYLPESNTVRWGTYGRGIWDLHLNLDPVASDEELHSPMYISAFPNPATGWLQIDMPNTHINEVLVVNAFGKVYTCQLHQNQMIDVSSLPAGWYVLQVVTDEGRATTNFIKQ